MKTTDSKSPATASNSGSSEGASVFAMKSPDDPLRIATPEAHKYRKAVCSTDTRGFAPPHNLSPFEIVLDATEGFIPLWAQGMNLRWRFNEDSLSVFHNPAAAKERIRSLFGEALLQWGAAVPVRFSERSDAWDFEITVSPSENCNINGCTLARAFFPDAGRHDLMIYPTLFEQNEEEQVETLIHEIGHIFGLRHFFAPVSETQWASKIFGTHSKFSIMNYGADSNLTEADKVDVSNLYESAWDGKLADINGTPIHLVKPYHLR